MIEYDHVVLLKNNVFNGRVSACNGMFKLIIKKVTTFMCFVDYYFISNFNIECSNFKLWQNRKQHINYVTMKDMSNQGTISYSGKHKDKYEICI